ncbi:hypothetical protein FRC18_002937 [Serendipita sp. 400]|nr:hypothetical protein FRC18_002937 [Serendipita sp. 400]
MLFGRKRQTFPPIKPALFLNQTLRSLEEARNLEASLPDDRSLVAAFRIYTNLIYTFQTIFSQPGPQGQDRIQPLDDEHIIYEIIEVAEDAAKGFDRLHERVSLSSAVGIRSGYYPSPSFPANISYAVSWLKSQAEAVQIQKGLEKDSTPAPENQPDTQDSAGPADISPSDLPGECDVCGDTFSDATRPSRNITKGCAHPANVCKSCISETVKAHLEDRGPAIAIACPDSACNQTLSREDVKAWVTPSVFARYDMLTLRELMRQDQGLFVWCQNPTCYSGQLHSEGASQPIVTCLRCSQRTCFTHCVLWHEGKTCKQYDRSRPIMDALNRSANRASIWWNTRNCPGCFQPIAKQGGCRHMRCRCGYSFTWWYAPVHWRRFIPFIKARSPGL